MDITVGILFYIVSCEYETEKISTCSDLTTVHSVACFHDGDLSPGIVYYTSEEDGLLVFAVDQDKNFCAFSEHMSMIKIRSVFDASLLQDIIFRFYHTQTEMMQAMIARKGLQKVLDYGASLLKLPFLLTRKDMSIMYMYPSPKNGDLSHNPFLNNEELPVLKKELILSKDFHNSAKYTFPFYYQVENFPQTHYCLNIMEDGLYYARIVVILTGNVQFLPSGAEQLVKLIADCCNDLIIMGQFRQFRNKKDLLHMMLHNVGNNLPISYNQYLEAIDSYGWLPQHEYRYMIVKVFDTTGWDSQLDATLEIIRNDLEETWPNSCAAISNQEIHWLINISYLPPDQNDKVFFKQLIIYIRENVCHVGVSDIFSNIQLVPFAKKQAETALILGNKRNPSHWFFRFDDYRISYIKETILEKGIPKEMIIHPAIQILAAYDRENSSELVTTLHTYLKYQSNATRAAEKLFIHRTTLFRRLERIRELTNINLDNEDEIFLLLLSFYF